jgi:virginiamycin B lyase
MNIRSLGNVVIITVLAVAASACSNSSDAVPSAAGASKTSPLTRPVSKRITITQFNDLPNGYHSSYFPAALAVGPDGALWVADNIDEDFGESAIARISTNGRRTQTIYKSGGAFFRGITAGPDGALWITENGQILRMTVAGKFKAFRPKNGGDPLSIVVGPDLALWFTESVGEDSAIGRITTQGKITLYIAPYGTQDIGAGPDGALWFTDPTQSLIGRITTQGKVTEYKDGITYGSAPYSIALGPDGALWFTEKKGRIGRITAKGKVTEYSSGITPKEQLMDLAAGPDQAMWFTEYRARASGLEGSEAKIGRITMTGEITEYSGFNSRSGPTGIVRGPDGNMWFVQTSLNGVARVDLSPP